MEPRHMLDGSQEQILRTLRQADGKNFANLVKIAKLDPARDFRGADLRGVDFGTSNLRGFDFTGADLSGARLDRSNTEGATFDDACTTEVVWPNPIDKRQSRGRIERYELKPVQLEVLDGILRALRNDQRRMLVSIPVGAGRSLIIERLLQELQRDRRYRVIMLVVESAAERDQYQQRLTGGVLNQVLDTSLRASANSGDVRLEVVTASSLLFNLRERDDNYDRFAADLVIAVGEPNRLLHTIQELERFGKPRAFVAVTGLPHGRVSSRVQRHISQLTEHFGGFLVTLNIYEAAKSDLVHQAVVEYRLPELGFPQRGAQGLAANQMSLFQVVTRDLQRQISERFQWDQCLVICRNVEAVEIVTSMLSEQLFETDAKPVFAVTSRSAPRVFWEAIESKHAIIVMTPAMALGSPPRVLWDCHLTVVLTAIEFPLADRLLFRPRPVNRPYSVILDYTGTFGRVSGADFDPRPLNARYPRCCDELIGGRSGGNRPQPRRNGRLFNTLERSIGGGDA